MALRCYFIPFILGIKIQGSQAAVSAGRALCHAKRGKISVDQTLSKLGSLDEFFQAMHPDRSGRFYQPKTMNQNLDLLIDEIMNERSATLWANLLFAVKRRIYAYGHEQLPAIMKIWCA